MEAGSSSGGKGWRQVARDVGNLQASALSWRGYEGHAGPPSLLDKKLQPYERLTASQLQVKAPAKGQSAFSTRSPAFLMVVAAKPCHVIL